MYRELSRENWRIETTLYSILGFQENLGISCSASQEDPCNMQLLELLETVLLKSVIGNNWKLFVFTFNVSVDAKIRKGQLFENIKEKIGLGNELYK
jgi:hypothetical protein